MGKNVRLAATSDLHGILEGIKEVCKKKEIDILAIAGDIQPADPFKSTPYWFRYEFFPLVRELGCEVVAIPGNHDFYLASHYQEIKTSTHDSVPSNFHLLVDEGIELEGIKFYGTPWVPFINGRWCFEQSDSDLVDMFNQIPSGIDVLLTHTPPNVPYWNIDVSLEINHVYQKHFGSRCLLGAIFENEPTLTLCGHIHSGNHEMKSTSSPKSGKTIKVCNVSRVNERYEIGYPIKVFSLGEVCGIKDITND